MIDLALIFNIALFIHFLFLTHHAKQSLLYTKYYCMRYLCYNGIYDIFIYIIPVPQNMCNTVNQPYNSQSYLSIQSVTSLSLILPQALLISLQYHINLCLTYLYHNFCVATYCTCHTVTRVASRIPSTSKRHIFLSPWLKMVQRKSFFQFFIHVRQMIKDFLLFWQKYCFFL